MSGYHSFELCYLASVYTNLLLTKQPMDFYFKPQPGAFKDNILRVQPDLLPPGSVRLEAVWLNGEQYPNFDAEAMTVKLPDLPAGSQSFEVKVRVVPAGLTFDLQLDIQGGLAELVLNGKFGDIAILAFKTELDKVVVAKPTRLVLRMEDTQTFSKECARVLAFARTKMAIDIDIFVVGANEQVTATLQSLEFLDEVTVMDTYDVALIGKA
jgi:anti-anti-sigma regulatory factor